MVYFENIWEHRLSRIVHIEKNLQWPKNSKMWKFLSVKAFSLINWGNYLFSDYSYTYRYFKKALGGISHVWLTNVLHLVPLIKSATLFWSQFCLKIKRTTLPQKIIDLDVDSEESQINLCMCISLENVMTQPCYN